MQSSGPARPRRSPLRLGASTFARRALYGSIAAKTASERRPAVERKARARAAICPRRQQLGLPAPAGGGPDRGGVAATNAPAGSATGARARPPPRHCRIGLGRGAGWRGSAVLLRRGRRGRRRTFSRGPEARTGRSVPSRAPPSGRRELRRQGLPVPSGLRRPVVRDSRFASPRWTRSSPVSGSEVETRPRKRVTIRRRGRRVPGRARPPPRSSRCRPAGRGRATCGLRLVRVELHHGGPLGPSPRRPAATRAPEGEVASGGGGIGGERAVAVLRLELRTSRSGRFQTARPRSSPGAGGS